MIIMHVLMYDTFAAVVCSLHNYCGCVYSTMYVCLCMCLYDVICFSFGCRVEAIYPVHDPLALQDSRVHSLVQYAMKVH